MAHGLPDLRLNHHPGSGRVDSEGGSGILRALPVLGWTIDFATTPEVRRLRGRHTPAVTAVAARSAGSEVTDDRTGDATRGLVDPSVRGWCAQSLARVEDAIATLVVGAGPFESLLAHVLATPGKRLRSLVTLAASCFDPRRVTPTPEAVEVAAAIELVHEAALL